MTNAAEAIKAGIQTLLDKKQEIWQEIEDKRGEYRQISDTINSLRDSMKGMPGAPKQRTRKKAPPESDVTRWIIEHSQPFTTQDLADAFEMSNGWAAGVISLWLATSNVLEKISGNAKKRVYRYKIATPVSIPTPTQVQTTNTKTTRKKQKKTGGFLKPEQIEEYIRTHPSFTSRDIADHFNRSNSWWEVTRPKYAHLLIEKRSGRGTPTIFEYRDPLPADSLAQVQADWDENNAAQAPIGSAGRRESSPVPGTGSNGRLSNNPGVRSLLDVATSQGYAVEKLNNNHIRVAKNGDSVSVSSTPSDRHAINQIKRDLAGIGVEFA